MERMTTSVGMLGEPGYRAGLNAFHLRLLGLVLMTLDHVYIFVPVRGIPVWFEHVSRVVAPMFVFLVVEGYHHTRDPRRYLLRLVCWSAVMAAGSDLVVRLFLRPHYKVIGNNIFLTLALCVLLLMHVDRFRQGRRARDLLGAAAVFCVSLFSEGGLVLLPLALAFHLTRGNRRGLVVSYLGISGAMAVIGALATAAHSAASQLAVEWMMVFALPLFIVYDGQRGPDLRWLFYVYYPAHIWILYILGRLIGSC